MGRRKGLNDRCPSLPPGCTHADVDRAMAGAKCPDCGRREAEGHADGCPWADPDVTFCMVCEPPPDAGERLAHVDGRKTLEDLPYCDDHGPDALAEKSGFDRDPEDAKEAWRERYIDGES